MEIFDLSVFAELEKDPGQDPSSPTASPRLATVGHYTGGVAATTQRTLSDPFHRLCGRVILSYAQAPQGDVPVEAGTLGANSNECPPRDFAGRKSVGRSASSCL